MLASIIEGFARVASQLVLAIDFFLHYRDLQSWVEIVMSFVLPKYFNVAIFRPE
jgi:hypothetical protein